MSLEHGLPLPALTHENHAGFADRDRLVALGDDASQVGELARVLRRPFAADVAVQDGAKVADRNRFRAHRRHAAQRNLRAGGFDLPLADREIDAAAPHRRDPAVADREHRVAAEARDAIEVFAAGDDFADPLALLGEHDDATLANRPPFGTDVVQVRAGHRSREVVHRRVETRRLQQQARLTTGEDRAVRRGRHRVQVRHGLGAEVLPGRWRRAGRLALARWRSQPNAGATVTDREANAHILVAGGAPHAAKSPRLHVGTGDVLELPLLADVVQQHALGADGPRLVVRRCPQRLDIARVWIIGQCRRPGALVGRREIAAVPGREQSSSRGCRDRAQGLVRLGHRRRRPGSARQLQRLSLRADRPQQAAVHCGDRLDIQVAAGDLFLPLAVRSAPHDHALVARHDQRRTVERSVHGSIHRIDRTFWSNISNLLAIPAQDYPVAGDVDVARPAPPDAVQVLGRAAVPGRDCLAIPVENSTFGADDPNVRGRTAPNSAQILVEAKWARLQEAGNCNVARGHAVGQVAA